MVANVNSNHNASAFSVQVSNSLGSATSRAAVLSVDFGTLGSPQTNRVLAMSSYWKYNVSATDLAQTWKPAAFDDASWGSGSALLYTALASRTNLITGGVLSTPLPLVPGALPPTCYFRTHFTNPFPASSAVAAVSSHRVG